MKFKTWVENENKPVIEQLKDFIEMAKGRINANQWLEDDMMKVYVRKSSRLVSGQRMNTLDIANIDVTEPGHGTGGKFFEQAHEMNPWLATYFESVLNNRLGRYLLKHGYKIDPGVFPLSYYKLKSG